MISIRLWFFEDNFIRDFTTEDTVIIISGSVTESGVAEQEFQTEDINADGMAGLDLEDLEGQHVSCWFKLKIASKVLHKIDIEINVFFLCKACSGISRSFIITCTNVANVESNFLYTRVIRIFLNHCFTLSAIRQSESDASMHAQNHETYMLLRCHKPPPASQCIFV